MAPSTTVVVVRAEQSSRWRSSRACNATDTYTVHGLRMDTCLAGFLIAQAYPVPSSRSLGRHRETRDTRGMAQRDRDAHGRARNARPRDGLGRPLPHGAAGVERIDEDLVLTPQESLEQAQQLLDDGRPFHAHEVLEGAWKTAPSAERALWKGLAQLAVGLTHLRRGNATGATALLRRAGDHIRPYGQTSPHFIAVDQLVDFAAETADHIEHAGLAALTHQQLTPRLRTTAQWPEPH